MRYPGAPSPPLHDSFAADFARGGSRNRETRRELQVFLSARGLSIDDLAADVGAGPMTLHGFQTWLESNLDMQAKTQWVEGMNVARIIARELPVGFTGDALAGSIPLMVHGVSLCDGCYSQSCGCCKA
eukprot:3448825-Rhodomonas_salina.1